MGCTIIRINTFDQYLLKLIQKIANSRYRASSIYAQNGISNVMYNHDEKWTSFYLKINKWIIQIKVFINFLISTVN